MKNDQPIGRRAFLKTSGIGVATGVLAGSLEPVRGVEPNPDSGATFNVRTAGAKGDGVSDDTAPIQASIDAAGKTGGIVFFPPGIYKTTAGLRCSAGNVVLAGTGSASTIRPAGNFDTLHFAPPGKIHLYRNTVMDLLFDETEKTGGRTIAGELVALFQAIRVHGVAGWDGWHFHNFGGVTLSECHFEGYRGACYGRATGGGNGKDKGRSDVLRLVGLVHGGTRKEGMIGIDIDGFVHTIDGWGVYLVGIGAQGLLVRNSFGAELDPTFLTFDALECDFPDLEGIRLEAGERFFFSNTELHCTRNAASNIYIGPKIKGVSFTGGFSTGAQHAGIEINGRDVTVSAMHFYTNSNPQFGGKKNIYPGILLGNTARDVIITGCRSGQEATQDFQSCGCRIEKGADGFVITGNDFRHNGRTAIENGAGTGETKIIANNL